MQERPEYITIAGQQVPLWCDLFVLNEIQEKYGDVSVFERKLLGMPDNAKKGEPVEWKKADIGTILFILPLMIKEGYKKEEMLEGCAMSHTSVDEIMVDVEFSGLLAIKIYNAYRRCFESKK